MAKRYTGKMKVGNEVIWFGGDYIGSAESLSDLEPDVPTLLPPSVYNSLMAQNQSNQEEEEQEPEQENN